MSDTDEYKTAFVLGKPIKNPADFYGREKLIGRLYDHILAMQPVSVVGEHRCGNTSVLYQLLHEDVRARYLTPADDARLIFAFVSAQLASENTEALFRRIALAIRRADPDAEVDPERAFDNVWLETYLEALGDRGRRLVLLLDEVELLADFQDEFWQWFEVLVAEYDLSVVTSSRIDLSQFRLEYGRGPAFFNLLRSEYTGSFTPETVQRFIKEKSEITEFDFNAVASQLADLAGRFPFYVQLASALIYLHAAGGSRISEAGMEEVRRDFQMRTQSLFADAWRKLPPVEREVLTRMARGSYDIGSHTVVDREALESLTRRGYVVDNRIFSSVFAEFVQEQ
jgi:hypothetical protein